MLRHGFPRPGRLPGLVLAAAVASSAPAPAQDGVDPQAPARHFRVEHPAALSGADALAIYARIRDDMAAGYRLSGDPVADAYRRWRRYSSVPYRSAQHGERFLNNYANEVAAGYGRFEDAGGLPVGAVVAKDSFTVTRRGDVFSGPLFVMEKMPAGFDPEARDWRYTMIMPDGSLFGRTGGEGDARVRFCVACHKAAGSAQDHLFFVPEGYRLQILE